MALRKASYGVTRSHGGLLTRTTGVFEKQTTLAQPSSKEYLHLRHIAFCGSERFL